MSPPERFDAWALPRGLPAPERTAEPGVEPGGGVLRHPVLSPAELGRLVEQLRAAGAALRDVPVGRIVRALGGVGARFGREDDPLRGEALGLLPAFAGVSPEQARHVLDGMARDWTAERLTRLLELELGDPAVLDGFRDEGASMPRLRRLRAFGSELAVHICAGTVPGVAATSLIRGLLVKGPVLLKPGAGDAVLPVLLARALAGQGEVGRALAAATAVLYWPGGSRETERAVLGAADLAVVYGSDDTVRELRSLLRPSARLVAYPHRVSVAVVGEGSTAAVAADLARAVASFDQRGCVCPHQVFLLGADPSAARAFARRLADALDAEAAALPPGPVGSAEAAAVQQLRGTVELRAAAGEPLELLVGAGLGWTLVTDPGPTFHASCLSRTVHVTPVPDVAALVAVLDPVRHHLQSVGMAGLGAREVGVVEALATLGAARCVPLADLPFPPAWWMHDGQGPLRTLVRWTEWVPAGP